MGRKHVGTPNEAHESDTYRFGSIGFLELVKRFETALQLSHQTEVLHLDSTLNEGEGEQHRCSDITRRPAA